MTEYTDKRLLPYSTERVYELVADVERYPEFLPLWREATLQPLSDEPQSNRYLTVQTIQIGPFLQSFQTEALLEQPNQIRITSDDTMFEECCIHWRFKRAPQDGCHLHFLMRCEARSRLLRPVLDVTFMHSARSIVHAFERRAHELYGRPNPARKRVLTPTRRLESSLDSNAL